MKLKMKMCCFNNFRPVGGWAVGEGSGVAWSVLRKHARTSALRFAFLAIADANADFGFGLLLGLFDLGFWCGVDCVDILCKRMHFCGPLKQSSTTTAIAAATTIRTRKIHGKRTHKFRRKFTSNKTKARSSERAERLTRCLSLSLNCLLSAYSLLTHCSPYAALFETS